MIRDIVVHVDDESRARGSVQLAAWLAARHGARLSGVHAVSLPDIPPYADVEIPDSVRQTQRARFTEVADAAEAMFRSVTSELEAGAGWYRETGLPDEVMRKRVLVADLAVVRRAAYEPGLTAHASLAADLVMGARRPVLVVPPEFSKGQLAGPALLAWNGSTESARAMSDALPLLVKAEGPVTVLSVTSSRSGDTHLESELDEVCAHLARHGIEATPRVLPGRSDTGQAVRDAAWETEAAFVVIGAYGRSRMRELLFGGVTEYMLSRCELPVLMSH